MLLQNKNAVIYGGGGAIGGAVARAFAREGAKVFLAGRTLEKLDAAAKEISSVGGVAETAQVDALDEEAVERHVEGVIQKVGTIARYAGRPRDVQSSRQSPGRPVRGLPGESGQRRPARATSAEYRGC